MILTAFRLHRDPHTRRNTFGYERQLWDRRDLPFLHFTPSVGCPIELESNVVPNIVKMIELYHYPETKVIERLGWQFGSEVFPYRVKYICPFDMMNTDESILFLPNVATIYNKLTGLPVRMSSPLEFYLDKVLNYGIYPTLNQSYLLEVYKQHRLRIDGIAYQHVDTATLKDFLYIVDGENLLGLEKYVIPKLVMLDPVSEPFMNRALQTRHLSFTSIGQNPFDTSEVGPITINHPHVTKYSPIEYHGVALQCDLISQQYSDLKIEYILSNAGHVEDRTTHLLVSRYLECINDRLLDHYCTMVVTDAHRIATTQHPEWSDLHHVVTFEMTFGDEVLIEIYTVDKKQCLYAVHLDLAMLALCSSDVIPQVA